MLAQNVRWNGVCHGNHAGAAEEFWAVAGVLRVRVLWGAAVPVQLPTCRLLCSTEARHALS